MGRKLSAPVYDNALSPYVCQCGNRNFADFVTDPHMDEIICTLCGVVAPARAFDNYDTPVLPRSTYVARHYWRERIRQFWMRDSSPVFFTERFMPELLGYYERNELEPVQELAKAHSAKSSIKLAITYTIIEDPKTGYAMKFNFLEKWIKILFSLSNLSPNYDVFGRRGFTEFQEEMDLFFNRCLKEIEAIKPKGRSHNVNINMLLQLTIYAEYGEDAWKESAQCLHIIQNKYKCQAAIDWLQQIVSRAGVMKAEDSERIFNVWLSKK